MVKNLSALQETRVRSLGQEEPPGEGNGYPLQYSCLENFMDRGTCPVTVHNKPSVSSHCVTEYFDRELNPKLKSRDSAPKFRPHPWSSTFLTGGESFPLSLTVLLTRDSNSMPCVVMVKR